MELNDLVNEYNYRKCRGPEDANTKQLVDAFDFFCANYVFIKHPNKRHQVHRERTCNDSSDDFVTLFWL